MMIEKDDSIEFDRIINVETDKNALETGQRILLTKKDILYPSHMNSRFEPLELFQTHQS
mgnify:CR=1 FL=1